MDKPEAVRRIVTFGRPDYAPMAPLDRAGRFATSRTHGVAAGEPSEAWIAARGLDGQVANMARLAYLSAVFVTRAPAVAARFAHAPGVASIGPDAEIDVTLDLSR